MSNTNGSAALTDAEWDAWVADKTEAVIGAACAQFGREHPDYVSLLGAVISNLQHEVERVVGGGGEPRHPRAVD